MISDIGEHPRVELDLVAIPWMDAYIHWTGLVFSGHDCLVSPAAVIAFATAEIKNMTEEDKIARKQKWAEFKEALTWQESFSQWFREHTYPREFLQKSQDLSQEEFEKLHDEHIRRARMFIRNYRELMTFSEADFTNAVPIEMQKRIRQNLLIMGQFYSLPITKLEVEENVE